MANYQQRPGSTLDAGQAPRGALIAAPARRKPMTEAGRYPRRGPVDHGPQARTYPDRPAEWAEAVLNSIQSIQRLARHERLGAATVTGAAQGPWG
jgi:hypothetical protein